MGASQHAGQLAEDRAQAMLTANGLRVLARNFRCKGGEIDLIMRDGDSLVFVEVRYRRSSNFGGALSSVDQRKRQRLIHAAQVYLATNPWEGPCRFDVVGFDGQTDNADGRAWVRDAFGI